MAIVSDLSSKDRSAAILAIGDWFEVDASGDTRRPHILHWRGKGDPMKVLSESSVRTALDELMLGSGALLLRGFSETEPTFFELLIDAMSGGHWARYREPQSPRVQLTRNVASSTEHPSSQRIHFHNENGHCMSFPQRIHFFCGVPARELGATPIASGRALIAYLSEHTRADLANRGVRYVRTYASGMGFDWPVVFGTTDRTAVEAYCFENEIEWEWEGSDRLRTWHARPAFVRHPQVGDDIWCNNIAHYHPSTLDPRTQRAYRLMLQESDMPFLSTYGDGAPFESETLDEIRAAYAAVAYRFDWRAGDLLSLDNIVFSHGRESFIGERRIFVAMTHPAARRSHAPIDRPAEVHVHAV